MCSGNVVVNPAFSQPGDSARDTGQHHRSAGSAALQQSPRLRATAAVPAPKQIYHLRPRDTGNIELSYSPTCMLTVVHCMGFPGLPLALKFQQFEACFFSAF